MYKDVNMYDMSFYWENFNLSMMKGNFSNEAAIFLLWCFKSKHVNINTNLF